jgi:phosphatidate phosphatase APP1
MSDWKEVITHLTANVEEHYDQLKLRLRETLGIGPVHLLPYLGYGTHRTLFLRGRVVSDYGVVPAEDNDSVWKNMLNMYQRFNSHEIPYASVRARFGTQEQIVTADEEGFFWIELELSQPLPTDTVWHTVDLELVEYPDQAGSHATGQILVPPTTAQFGVISDLDDTVIQTDVLHLLKLARNVFLRNSRSRLPFAGVAEFYLALQQGTHGSYNPFYYVSNGPWNLYDLIMDFFTVRRIPLGAFFLLDLGTTRDHIIRPEPREHKLGAIRTILETQPNLPFILIGDSGEGDPEVYLQVVHDFPGRISAIYIRDVAPSVRDEEIKHIVLQAREAGSEMLLVPDTVAAAVHASEHGFISPDALPAIRQERQEDKREPEPLEKAIDALTKK